MHNKSLIILYVLTICNCFTNIIYASHAHEKYKYIDNINSEFVEDRERCRCYTWSWFTGFQISSGSLITKGFGHASELLDRNLGYWADANYRNFYNKKLGEQNIDGKKVIKDFYNDCIESDSLTVDYEIVSLKYMMGTPYTGIDLFFNFGISNLVNTTTKYCNTNNDIMYKYYVDIFHKQPLPDNVSIANVKKLKEQDSQKKNDKGENDQNKDKGIQDPDDDVIPSKIKFTSWYFDAGIDFIHAYTGDMIYTDGPMRQEFLFLGYVGLGYHQNFGENVETNISKKLNKRNTEYFKKSFIKHGAILRIGFQCIWPIGITFELKVDTMTPYLLRIDTNDISEYKDDYRYYKIFKRVLWKFRCGAIVGFDFYGLLCGANEDNEEF